MNRAIAAISVLALNGCASVTAERVKPGNYDTKGVRYWLAAPYLVVRSPIEVARAEAIYQLNPTTGTLTQLAVTNAGGTARASATQTEFGARIFRTSVDQEPVTPGKTEGPGTPAATKPVATGEDKPTEKPAEKPAAAPSLPFSKPEALGERAAPANLADAVAIQWLPDYCQQYAFRQTAVLAGLKVKVTLADGWKLSSLESEGDSTAVMNKLIDLVGTGIGARRDIAVETIKAEAASAEEQADVVRYLRRTKITYLKPGLYSLVSAGCDTERTISLSKLEYETADVWSELAFVPVK